MTINSLETPVGPGSTIGAVAIVNAIKVRTAELLVARGAMPPVITRASVVGATRSRALFDEAYREHARRLARAIDLQGGGRASALNPRTDVVQARGRQRDCEPSADQRRSGGP